MWQFGVAHLHIAVIVAEIAPELLTHINGAVLTTGATDGNGHVTTIAVGKRGQPGIQEARDVIHHLTGQRFPFQKFDDRLINAGVFAQAGVPVWIGQAAYVEDIV